MGGKIPDGWREVRLGDVANIIGGGTPSTANAGYWNGIIPWITPKDLSNHQDRYIQRGSRSISLIGLQNSSAVLLPKNSILLSTRAPIGYVAIAQKELTTSQGFKTLLLNEQNHYKFFYYLLKCSKEIFESYANGSTFKEISAGTLKILKFSIPPLAEQQAIADILCALDDKIELNRRMAATLEHTAAALFKSWFVDFDPVHAKAQGKPVEGLAPDIAALFPSRFIDSPLGKIPEGWGVGSLEECIKLFDSRRVPLSGLERAKRKGTFPYYGANGILDYVNQYIFDGTYLLLGEDGSVAKKDSGNPYVYLVSGQFWVNNHAHVMQGNDQYSTEFVYLFLRQTNITPYVTGAVQPKISQANLNRIPVIKAGTQINYEFSLVVKIYFEKVFYLNQQTQTLIQLRDTLLPKLISGELRVGDIKI